MAATVCCRPRGATCQVHSILVTMNLPGSADHRRRHNRTLGIFDVGWSSERHAASLSQTYSSPLPGLTTGRTVAGGAGLRLRRKIKVWRASCGRSTRRGPALGGVCLGGIRTDFSQTRGCAGLPTRRSVHVVKALRSSIELAIAHRTASALGRFRRRRRSQRAGPKMQVQKSGDIWPFCVQA